MERPMILLLAMICSPRRSNHFGGVQEARRGEGRREVRLGYEKSAIRLIEVIFFSPPFFSLWQNKAIPERNSNQIALL